MTETLLRVENLRTGFETPAASSAPSTASISSSRAGGTLGVVGESGCGKTVTALSIMRLVDRPGRVAARPQILFEGRDLATLARERDARRSAATTSR